MKPISVMIVEDQSMVLGALEALLNLESDIDVVATAQSAEEALEKMAGLELDILVTDIELPQRSGLELAQSVSQDMKVLMLTTFARAGYLRRALDAGAKAYLLKDAPSAELADAIRRIHQGAIVIQPELAAQAWEIQDPLNDRERHILRMAGEGLSSANIATQLGLSEGTVRNYLSEIISKLGVSNRIEAARLARKKGLL